MDIDATHKLRAETLSGNTDYLGDDVMEIWLKSDVQDGGHLIATNAKGAVSHKYYRNGKLQDGEEIKKVRNYRQGTRWQMFMEIPLETLEWKIDEIKEGRLKINLSIAYSIAPRRRLWWNSPEYKKDFEQSLVPANFVRTGSKF